MSLPLKNQLVFQLPITRENEGLTYFTSILSKKEKTLEDAQIIYEKIRGFPSFQNFFTDNLNKLDTAKILNLCQGFRYERCDRGSFVFKQGEASNNKFYIILAGEVAVINNQNLGNFGETHPKSPTSLTFLTSKDYLSSRTSLGGGLSARELEGKVPNLKSLVEMDNERKRVIKRVERVGAREDLGESGSSQQIQTQTTIGKSKGINKMRAVYDAVKALRGMQRSFPGMKKMGGSLSEIDRKEPSTVATLQYLDEPEDKEETERKEFEAFAGQYGKIIHYLGVGESFGEIALKKNGPRTAGILCRKECEFLTLEKQQFDEVFGKIEKEREQFLKSVFPILTSFSSANYNYLVCFFKTERFSKGSYIIHEGTRGGPKAKFYVIQSGECVLEKRIAKKQGNPYSLKQTLTPSCDNMQIAVAGKGSIVGEEIIEAQEAYEYSVKALSDNVIVQAITKRDFKHRFPQDFQEYVASVYETKQSHRETIISNLKKDEQPAQRKGSTVYIGNTTIPHLATKSAKNCFNRYLQRESRLDGSSLLRTTVSPRGQQVSSHRETSLASAREHLNSENIRDALPLTFRGPTQDEEVGQLKTDRTTKGDRVAMKIEFLNRVASPPKNTINDEEGTLENAKFFTQLQNEKDRKAIKIRLAQMTKQYNKGDKKAVSDSNKGSMDTADIIVNKFFNKKEDLEYLYQILSNPTGMHEGTENNNTRPNNGMPKSLTQSRRSSKAGSLQDLNSLYNQKILKGRPSVRPVSPLQIRLGENDSKPESLNDLSCKECLVITKPEQVMKPAADHRHSRKVGSMGFLSSKALRIYHDGQSVKTERRKNREEEDVENKPPSSRRLTTEDEKELLTNRLLKKERLILQERTLNMNDMSKKKGSPRTSLSSLSRNCSSKGENTMYSHLNEMKEWRLKVFRKPQRMAVGMKSLRAMSDSRTIVVEGKNQFEG